MNSLTHCIYSSTASSAFEEHEIPGLLERIRPANAARNITGMLLYIEGSFFQVLEGEPTAVDETLGRIKNDPRHTRITVIIREPIVGRSFGEWSMGFETIALCEAGELVGENDFFQSASCISKLSSGRAKKLLSAFRNGRWRAERTGTNRVLSRSA